MVTFLIFCFLSICEKNAGVWRETLCLIFKEIEEQQKITKKIKKIERILLKKGIEKSDSVEVDKKKNFLNSFKRRIGCVI